MAQPGLGALHPQMHLHAIDEVAIGNRACDVTVGAPGRFTFRAFAGKIHDRDPGGGRVGLEPLAEDASIAVR